MTTEEILAAAYQANPEYVEKTAQALLVLEKWGMAEDLKQDINTITAVTLEKTASFEEHALKGGLAVAGGIALGVGGAVAGDLYDAAKRGLTKGKNYRAIMASNPELKSLPPKDLKNAYNTLHRYAPDFTADPSLGGQILKTMANLPENQYALVQQLLLSRKTLAESKKNQFAFNPKFGGKDK